MGLPGAAAWPDHGLVPSCSSEPGKQEHSGLSHELSPRSKPGWVCPKAGKAQLAVAERSRGYSFPNVPRCFGASPRQLHATSAHPPAQGQGPPPSSLLILLTWVSRCPSPRQAGEPSRAPSISSLPAASLHGLSVTGSCCSWGGLPKTQAVLPPPQGAALLSAGLPLAL